MSTAERFEALARAVRRSPLNQSILTVPAVKSGSSISEHDQKTKRKFRPNVGPFSWPVTLLSEDYKGGTPDGKMTTIRMRTQLGKVKDYERAGGVEGVLVSLLFLHPENLG